VGEYLERNGISVAVIHGNKSQNARTRALAGFKAGRVTVLVATDIAARGLDIDQLPHVVNYELPEVAEHYVHRIGRTGRAGNEGLAVSLVANDERPLLKQIERLLGYGLPVRTANGYVPAPPQQGERDGQRPSNPSQPRGGQPRPGHHGHRGGQNARHDGGRRHGGRNQRRGSPGSRREQGRG
jgi:ATP-dependent RNA helicase RhlE